MSSFKKAHKASQKPHRERSQPAARAHLGFLEKKKDYKVRARDFKRKQDTLKRLRLKALNKNPDEFYYNMVRARMEAGEHHQYLEAPDYNKTQLLKFNAQDRSYVNYRRSLDLQKIEKMKKSMHLTDSQRPLNKHTIFTDSKKEAAEFDAAKHFDTHPALLDRRSNRPRTSALAEQDFDLDDVQVARMSLEKRKMYRGLTRRIQREQKLRVLGEKLDIKSKLIAADQSRRKKLIKEETDDSAAVYKWAPVRQK